MVEAGKLAVIKTSNEEVFVLSVETPTTPAGRVEVRDTENFMIRRTNYFDPYSRNIATVTVRRPTMTDAGIVHHVENFYIDELESSAERQDRELASRVEMQKKFLMMKAELGTVEEGGGLN